MAKKGQTFNNYPKEIKVEILRKYFEEYISVRALSEEYGISPKTIQNWVKKAEVIASVFFLPFLRAIACACFGFFILAHECKMLKC